MGNTALNYTFYKKLLILIHFLDFLIMWKLRCHINKLFFLLSVWKDIQLIIACSAVQSSFWDISHSLSHAYNNTILKMSLLHILWRTKFSHYITNWYGPHSLSVCLSVPFSFLYFCFCVLESGFGNILFSSKLGMTQISAKQGPNSSFVFKANV